MLEPPASTSLMDRPVIALVVSSAVVCATGTVLIGASLTAVTVMATVSTSVSVPPEPVLPLSLVVIVNVAAPLKLAVGI